MRSPAGPVIWWLRRDLRLADNPALLAAVTEGEAVLPLLVLDPVLLRAAGVRGDWLRAALHTIDGDLRAGGGPGLSVVAGDPRRVVPQVAAAAGARRVHVAADFAPYGRRRDEAVRAALALDGVHLVATGSPYAVAPGTLRRTDDQPFQVFAPFHRAWQEHGAHDPASDVDPASVRWLAAEHRDKLPPADPGLVEATGERTARRAWRAYLDRDQGGVSDYATLRNVPGADATSHVSKALRWGHLHPRTLLADLARRRSPGAAALAREIAWRDFFADVLYHRPDAVRSPVRREFRRMRRDEPTPGTAAAERLAAWQQGRTGYPLVDAGMRQLVVEHWMHNRVRMVVASFLVKDLHLGWEVGAQWFLQHLHDGDLAQNQLNWQWVAGCGTDAAPFFRVFNPTGQAQKFDPNGSYIRRFVPELADVPDESVHEPWTMPGGPPNGYPTPIVDHAVERREALDRYAELKG